LKRRKVKKRGVCNTTCGVKAGGSENARALRWGTSKLASGKRKTQVKKGVKGDGGA